MELRSGRSAVRSLALVLFAGASLAACATPQPRLAIAPPAPEIAVQPPAPTPVPPPGSRKGIGRPYQVGGVWYVPRWQPDYDQIGVASWYGPQFHMQRTANGELFDMNAISAAHTTLPLPCIVEVTNLDNGRRLNVRVNDRGPFVGGRVIDLSRAAARELGYDRRGLAHVRVRYVGPADLGGPETGLRYAARAQTAPGDTLRKAEPRKAAHGYAFEGAASVEGLY